MAQSPQVTEPIPCPDCAQLVQPIGKQTAAMALGNHRWKEHGVRSPKKKGGKKAGTPDPQEQPTPLAVVRNITDPLEGGKGAPSATQLGHAIGRGYGYLMMFRVSRIVEADPRLTDDQRVVMIEHLAPAEQTCEAVASPLARVLARSKLNRTVGRQIVDNIDYADAFVALIETERSLARYAREVKQVKAGVAGGNVATLVPGAPAAAPTSPGPTVPAGAGAADYYAGDGPRSPAPVDGVVVDAAMVAASAGVVLPDLPPDVNYGTASPISMEVTQ